MSLIQEVVAANAKQRRIIVEKLEKLLGSLEGKTICVLGLAFKAETDDVRESPAIDIVRMVLERGALVHVHDPQALQNAKQVLGDAVVYFEDMYEAMEHCDALVILTEWNCYRNIDLDKVSSSLRGRVILDARNVLDPERAKEKGFLYEGVGRR
jgi:UDPglucose 6-dehydrogenase